jgi:hypothetical protein
MAAATAAHVATATSAASAPATPPPALTGWTLFKLNVGAALAENCVAASMATPLARAAIVIAYRIGNFLSSIFRAIRAARR